MRPTNRGANGKNGSKWIRPERRLVIYHRDGFACVYCLLGGVKLSLDHMVPRSLGGTNENDNLVTACLTCNAERQAGHRRWLRLLRARGVDTVRLLARVRAARRRRVDLAAGKQIKATKCTTCKLSRRDHIKFFGRLLCPVIRCCGGTPDTGHLPHCEVGI